MSECELFLSYKRIRREHVEYLNDFLRALNYVPWYDARLSPGERWADQLDAKISEAKLVIALLCSEAVKPDSYVLKEIELALKHKGKLIPVLCQKDIQRPDWLNELHLVDLTEWDGDPSSKQREILLDAINPTVGDRSLDKNLWTTIKRDWKRSAYSWYPTDEVGGPRINAKRHIRIDANHYENPRHPWYLPGAGSTEWFRDASFGPEMVVIPAEQPMLCGSPEGERDAYNNEQPEYLVRIPQPFALSRMPITVGQWNHYLEDIGRAGDRRDEQVDLPIQNITWREAKTFAAWLARKTRKPYRLVSEAEWEYAARGKREREPYYWGDSIRPNHAVYAWSEEETTGGDFAGHEPGLHPVGRWPANEYGLHDMLGNVAEWVADSYVRSYKDGLELRRIGKPVVKDSRRNGDGIIRGGSWRSAPRNLRCAARQSWPKRSPRADVGFRVARDLPVVDQVRASRTSSDASPLARSEREHLPETLTT